MLGDVRSYVTVSDLDGPLTLMWVSEVLPGNVHDLAAAR
jgi:hypothetical protein